jgi:hypothetical protein
MPRGVTGIRAHAWQSQDTHQIPIKYDNVSEKGMLRGASILSSEMPPQVLQLFLSLSLSLNVHAHTLKVWFIYVYRAKNSYTEQRHYNNVYTLESRALVARMILLLLLLLCYFP